MLCALERASRKQVYDDKQKIFFVRPVTFLNLLVMAVNYFILLFILLTTVPAHVSPLKVYTLGQNSKRSSVVEILNSSIHELDQFTICGRLLTSSFTTSSHVWQNILFKVLKIRIIFMNSCQKMGLEVNFSQGFQKLRKI